MKTCVQCHSEILGSNRYCDSCGTLLSSVEPETPKNGLNPRIEVKRGDTGLDKSVTSVDQSRNTTTSFHDGSVHETKTTHVKKTIIDDHSSRNQTSVEIGSIFVGSPDRPILTHPCPICGQNLHERQSYRCPKCNLEVCQFHATTDRNFCIRCASSTKRRRLFIGVACVITVAVLVALGILSQQGKLPSGPTSKIDSSPPVQQVPHGKGENTLSSNTQPQLQSDFKSSDGAAIDTKAVPPAEPTTIRNEIATKTTSAKAPATPLSTVKADDYINRAAFNPDVPAILILSSDNVVDNDVTGQVAAALGGSDGLFKVRFVRDGFFARAYGGDSSVVSDLELDRAFSALVLGVSTTSTSPQVVAGQSLFHAETKLSVRIFKRETGFASKGFVVVGTGIGFSDSDARRSANLAMVKKLLESM